MVLSCLSSTRMHLSFPSYNVYFSLKNIPAAIVTSGPALHSGHKTRSLPHCNSCFFPPPSRCSCPALMPWVPSCTGGYWDCVSWPASLPCTPGLLRLGVLTLHLPPSTCTHSVSPPLALGHRLLLLCPREGTSSPSTGLALEADPKNNISPCRPPLALLPAPAGHPTGSQRGHSHPAHSHLCGLVWGPVVINLSSTGDSGNRPAGA